MKLTTRSDVYVCLQAFADAAALGAALELGLFWRLTEQPLDVRSVAQAPGIPANRCRYWLQLLHGMGLLDQVPQGYVSSELARTAILDAYSQESWAYLAQEEREHYRAACDLALHIREPGPISIAQGNTTLSYVQKLMDDPDRARRFAHLLYELHQPLAAQLVDALDMTSVERMMDLGGGSGVVSLALLDRYLHLSSVVVDLENTCLAGREIASRHPAAGRTSYYAIDFVRQPLPGGFDLILQCDCSVYGAALFRKLRAALKQGGRLVIVDHLAGPHDPESVDDLYWTFLDSLADPTVEVTTAAQVRSQLAEAAPLSRAPPTTTGWKCSTHDAPARYGAKAVTTVPARAFKIYLPLVIGGE